MNTTLMRYAFSFLLFLIFQNTSFAFTGDSTKYLTVKDTLFLSLDETTGEKIIDHKIVKGQTLYSLARFYGMNEEQLYPYNPTLKSNKVSIGQVVKVPIPNIAIKRFKGDNFKRWKYVPIMFQVKKQDNLYKIAKRVFNMSPDSVMAWNGLSDNNISPGQHLHVGWVSLEGIPDTLRGFRPQKMDVRGKSLGESFAKQKKKTVEVRGAAFWQKKGSQNTDYYCLHRTAKVGSVIEITNGQNGKKTFAKVIGKIPENAYGNEVIVILAPSVAKQLGAVDEKFFVKLKYAL